jgi:hypothetical protein
MSSTVEGLNAIPPLTTAVKQSIHEHQWQDSILFFVNTELQRKQVRDALDYKFIDTAIWLATEDVNTRGQSFKAVVLVDIDVRLVNTVLPLCAVKGTIMEDLSETGERRNRFPFAHKAKEE